MATSEPPTTIPPALRHGDTIAFISPSCRFNTLFPLRLERATSALTHLGFHSRTIFTNPLPTSLPAAIRARCAEIHTAFADPAVHAIVCTIGGLSANELLPFLDYDLIRANPKIFVGYSDITLLHHALYVKAGLRTFYGPAAITQLAEYPAPLPFTRDHFLHVLGSTGDVPVGPIPCSESWTEEFLDWATEATSVRARTLIPNPGWKWLRPGTATGRIFGGCLPSILQLAGTAYWPDYAGKILLLELPDWDAPEKGMPVDFARTALADLINAGVLGQVVGVVTGRPYKYTEDECVEWEKLLVEMCEVAGMCGPVLAGVDVGHTDPQLTIPLGAMCRVDAGTKEFVMLEAGVTKRRA